MVSIGKWVKAGENEKEKTTRDHKAEMLLPASQTQHGYPLFSFFFFFFFCKSAQNFFTEFVEPFGRAAVRPAGVVVSTHADGAAPARAGLARLGGR